ncbi:hypothetical protein LCGC14_1426800, partial [marine sediment metagenome]
MGRAVLLTFFFVLAICLYNTAVWADVGVESSPVSEGKTAETVSDEKGPAEDIINEDEELEDVDVELEKVFVKDPIRKYNRAIFTFNDKLYFYFMKPMYKGYNK